MTPPVDRQFFPHLPVWTPEIDRKTKLVANWMAYDIPGGHIWGIQGAGKSNFGAYANAVLPGMLGGATTFDIWSFLGFRQKTDIDVLKVCLIKMGCRAVNIRDRQILELRLVEAIAEKCSSSTSRRVAIIVDEFQNISPECYGVFMSVMETLKTKGFLPFLLTIGQPEMQQGIELMHQNNALQIINRFVPVIDTFRGLDRADIEEFLQTFDGENHKFSREWFPKLCLEGWSIEDLVDPINQALDLMLVDRNIAATLYMPMGYLRPALNIMFNTLMKPEANAQTIGVEIAKSAFASVGFYKVIGKYVIANV